MEMRGLDTGENVAMPDTSHGRQDQNQADWQPHLHSGKAKMIVRSLGLRKINQMVERPDTPAFRGFVKKIPHLLALVD